MRNIAIGFFFLLLAAPIRAREKSQPTSRERLYAAGAQFSHIRSGLKLQIPTDLKVATTIRGNFRIFEFLPLKRNDYYLMLASFHLRRDALHELIDGPCRIPEFPGAGDFSSESECETEIAGNSLRRKLYFNRSGHFFHLAYLTWEESAADAAERIITSLELNPSFCYLDSDC